MYLSKLILCRNARINFLNSEAVQLNTILDSLTSAIHHNQRCITVSKCESDAQILYANKEQLSIKVNIKDLTVTEQGRILCEPVAVTNISSLHQQEVHILGKDKIILQDGSRMDISEISTPQANKKFQTIKDQWLLAGQDFGIIQSAIDRVTCLANLSVILSTVGNKGGRQNEKSFHCNQLESISLPQGKTKEIFLEFMRF